MAMSAEYRSKLSKINKNTKKKPKKKKKKEDETPEAQFSFSDKQKLCE